MRRCQLHSHPRLAEMPEQHICRALCTQFNSTSQIQQAESLCTWLQGTACSALAGIYGALRVQGKPPAAIKEQRIIVVGAGSAGMGVTAMLAKAMAKHGFSGEQAASHFWVLDAGGLVTHHRRELPPHVQARPNCVQTVLD